MNADELQVIMTAGMPPLESHRIGSWLLRASAGYTGRANSVLPVGDPGIPVCAAIDQVAVWYAERDQAALVQLSHGIGAQPADSPLGELLAQRDWRFFRRTVVMTKSTRKHEASAHPSPVRIAVSDVPTDDWWRSASPRALEHRRTLRRMLQHVPVAAYLTAYVDNRPVGHLRLAFSNGWSGVFDVHTERSARGRGVARALMHRAEETATDRRIPLQYLQVAADNLAAVSLYRSLGWQSHHEYHYATPEV